MADGSITPCNVARSRHWFRQVTAPCNAACGSEIVTVNCPSGSTLQRDTWLWDDMPLNLPGGSTLQCGMWLWNRDSEHCPSASTLQRDTWLWDDMPLNLPGGSTLQCGMWLWNRDSELSKWQHPATWYVALGWHAIEFARWQHPVTWHVALKSWHWIRQATASCNVAGGSGTTRHWICPNVHHIGILHLVSLSTTSPQSTDLRHLGF